jgi:hypothetical protein
VGETDGDRVTTVGVPACKYCTYTHTHMHTHTHTHTHTYTHTHAHTYIHMLMGRGVTSGSRCGGVRRADLHVETLVGTMHLFCMVATMYLSPPVVSLSCIYPKALGHREFAFFR